MARARYKAAKRHTEKPSLENWRIALAGDNLGHPAFQFALLWKHLINVNDVLARLTLSEREIYLTNTAIEDAPLLQLIKKLVKEVDLAVQTGDGEFFSQLGQAVHDRIRLQQSPADPRRLWLYENFFDLTVSPSRQKQNWTADEVCQQMVKAGFKIDIREVRRMCGGLGIKLQPGPVGRRKKSGT